MIKKYIKGLSIGGIYLKNNVFLAPMAGVTDVSFRYICSKFNVGAKVTEMISAKGLMYNDKKTLKLMEMHDNEFPRIVQIFGSEEEVLKQTIMKINKLDYVDIIDFNIGCPAPKVVKNGDGAELLLNVDKIESLITQMMSVTQKPITVKMRIGYTSNNIVAIDVAKICEKCGIAAITIHGRTKQDLYTGKVNLDVIKKVKESVNIPVIGNGDIIDINSAIEMFEYTKVDAIMIGRASMR